jgi:hypothetical protein
MLLWKEAAMALSKYYPGEIEKTRKKFSELPMSRPRFERERSVYEYRALSPSQAFGKVAL